MNLYEILELNSNASEDDIRKSYKRLILLYHPDKNNDPSYKEKFQNIKSAYEILINPTTRKDYCKLNINEQHNFLLLLQKIFKNNLLIEELQSFGIIFDNKDWDYLENNFIDLLHALNFKELLVFFNQGIFPKKKIDTIINSCSSDSNIIEYYESYNYLPIYYQKINNLDIIINLNITLEDIFENTIKKIKIKRNINKCIINNTFIFNTDNQYIIFQNYGDNINNSCGNLIIKLNLPSNYYWDNNIIIIEQIITLYDLIYGLDINLKYGDNTIYIPKWLPYRDGFIIELNKFSQKKYLLNIKLIFNYEHTPEKEQLLLQYFIN